ncbi:cysteine desulfurase NifS [Telmatospirillum siberiense]|uniref:Cysteine desulfurase n=2 Tax=Telmatospirillum siberiense TaxID=382514 RepID=A0A2N3PNG6_9PROT|nr:cysteine desulfurase NifS [Telmatospirillum siberiense]PKU21937.1 cysteine desulfurase NifS [Telmatospirillum siberiense]
MTVSASPRTVYLDNNATTACAPDVVAEMLPFFTEQFGNPSSIHAIGASVAPAIRTARERLQNLLGVAHESEIVYTSGGTESDTTAIISALRAYPERREIITSAVEHHAVLTVCEHLARHEGYKLHVIPVDGQGRLDLKAYENALSENVAVVSIMWANNETGTIFPIEHLAQMAKPYGILFHTDAVQAVGKVPFRLSNSAIDMLSLSAHKIHGPKGVGALYLKRGVKFRPLFRGGHQERGRRAGTENTAGIVGLGKAAELAQAGFRDENIRVRSLRDRLERELMALIPNTIVTGDVEQRLPNTTTIAFEFVEGEAILLMLSRAGIAASSGSACTSGSLEPSHVMRAMNIPFTAAHGATRFSLSRDNTEEDVDRVIAVLPGIIERLRAMSPYWSSSARAPAEFQPAYS